MDEVEKSMEKKSIWKRFGDWLHGSQMPESSEEVIHHDAEGILVESDDAMLSEGKSMNVSVRNKKDQLAAMEESFNRLIEVLESLNENVLHQREQNDVLITRMTETNSVIKSLPANVESQGQAVKVLAEQVKATSQQNQKIIETVQTLPELTKQQVTQLKSMSSQMETSNESNTRIANSFGRFDDAVQGMVNNSKAQTMSLANMGQMLEKSETQMQDLMRQQSRRFSWLLGIVLTLSLAAVGVLCFMLINKG